MCKPKSIYALYKGEEIIDVGTIEEISERQGIKKNTLYQYSSKHKKGTAGKTIVVKVEHEEGESEFE
jgi:hypothetical protein